MSITDAQRDEINRGDLNTLAEVLRDIGFGTILQGLQSGSGLDANAVTGPALSAGSMRLLAFAGHNGAGACTATGAKKDDTVVGVIDLAAGSVSAAADFESTITVADQIQQSSASDLSAVKYALLLVAKS